MRNLLLIILSLLVSSCTQDDETVIVETVIPVLPAKPDSTGITVGGGDFGFDDGDEPPTTSINNPVMD